MRKIQDLLEVVMHDGWTPRMSVLPLVTWRRRSFNTLSDALANLAMDHQRDFYYASPDLDGLSVPQSAVLQWHSDGGSRAGQHAACVFSVIVLSKLSSGALSRSLLYAQALYLGPGINSMQAEIAALRSALSSFRPVVNFLRSSNE